MDTYKNLAVLTPYMLYDGLACIDFFDWRSVKPLRKFWRGLSLLRQQTTKCDKHLIRGL